MGEESGDQPITAKVVGFLRNPIVLIVAFALLIRLICAPFIVYDFDIYHWAVIMENINSGNGLYELTGYFYTPVWGYVMGFIDMIWNAFLSIDVFGIRVTELFPIENLDYIYHKATVTSPEFNTAFKIPLIICDFIVGYIIYKVVSEMTGDKKKSTTALALWLLCPIVIYMSGVQAMFDTISALLMLLCVILFWKRYYFLGGVMLSFATLLKFFPGFCLVVFVALIIVRHREEGTAYKNLLFAALGGILGTIVIMLPNIMSGNILDTLSFVLDRVGSDNLLNTIYNYAMVIFALFCMFYLGYRMYKSKPEDIDSNFLKYVMLTLTAAVLISPSPQYVIVLLPYLILYVLTVDRGYTVCLMMVGIGAMLTALAVNNFSLLASASAFFGWVSPEWVISCMQSFETMIGNVSLMTIVYSLFGAVMYIGLAFIFLFSLEGPIRSRWPKIGNAIDRVKSTCQWGRTDENVE